MEAYFACSVEQFYGGLARAIQDCLALALFIHPDELLLRVGAQARETFTPSLEGHLAQPLRTILLSGEPQYFDYKALLDWSLALAGNSLPPYSGSIDDAHWAMSCDSGQAIWLSILDTMAIERNGFMSLSWARGRLTYRGESYKYVTSPPILGSYLSPSEPMVAVPDDVLRPMNLFPSVKTTWKVTVAEGEQQKLYVQVGFSDNTGQWERLAVSASIVLHNLTSGLLLEHCPHDAHRALVEPDASCFYTGPVSSKKPIETSLSKDNLNIGVVAVDGDKRLQFASAACSTSYAPVIIRRAACLSCCIAMARKTGFPIIIL